jgi:hypothetical protein
MGVTITLPKRSNVARPEGRLWQLFWQPQKTTFQKSQHSHVVVLDLVGIDGAGARDGAIAAARKGGSVDNAVAVAETKESEHEERHLESVHLAAKSEHRVSEEQKHSLSNQQAKHTSTASSLGCPTRSEPDPSTAQGSRGSRTGQKAKAADARLKSEHTQRRPHASTHTRRSRASRG